MARRAVSEAASKEQYSRMQIGILGTDRWAASVASAAAARGNVLVRVEERGGREWEHFLDTSVCDAVVVGADGWSPARAEAVRTMIQVARPLVVSQPLEVSMLWAWELEMIRRDTRGVVVPILPARLHPWASRLRTVIEAAVGGGGPMGVIESVAFERRLPERSREAVLAALSRDADLIRALVGEPKKLSALGVAAEDRIWNSLTVGFSGSDLIPVQWQVAGGSDAVLDVTVRGQRGAIVVTIPDDGARPWLWTGPDQPSEVPSFGAGDTILKTLDAAIAGVPGFTLRSDALPPATWADAARAIELAETVPRSLTKGRAIDLHHEEFSELGTFRGTMASLGCGIILAALALVVVAVVVGGIANELEWDLGTRIAGAWPLVALIVLSGFLLLQLLPWVVRGDRRDD